MTPVELLEGLSLAEIDQVLAALDDRLDKLDDNLLIDTLYHPSDPLIGFTVEALALTKSAKQKLARR